MDRDAQRTEWSAQQQPQQEQEQQQILSDSQHHRPLRSPRTPASTRTKAAASKATPSPGTRAGGRKSGSTSNTPAGNKNSARDSTTPAYPESIALVKSTISSAKLKLSDMQPVDAQILDQIKNLEISLKQHRDSEEQFHKAIKSAQQDLNVARTRHEHVIQTGEAQLHALERTLQRLQQESLNNSGRLQELWDLERSLGEDLASKDNRMVEIRAQFVEMKRHRTEILKEREETESASLEDLRAEKAQLLVEYDEILEMQKQCPVLSNELEKSFGIKEAEELKQRIREQDERIEQLEAMFAESRGATVVEEKKADELVLLFEKVYERRIRTHTQELEAALQHAEQIERKRDQEANAALEEYLRVNQLSVEAEEKASREEFSLLAEKEELSEMENTLEAMKMALQACETAAANS